MFLSLSILSRLCVMENKPHILEHAFLHDHWHLADVCSSGKKCSCDQKTPAHNPSHFFKKPGVIVNNVWNLRRGFTSTESISLLCCHRIITYGVVSRSMPVEVRVYIQYAYVFFFPWSYLPWFLMVCIRSLAPLPPEYILSVCAMEHET